MFVDKSRTVEKNTQSPGACGERGLAHLGLRPGEGRAPLAHPRRQLLGRKVDVGDQSRAALDNDRVICWMWLPFRRFCQLLDPISGIFHPENGCLNPSRKNLLDKRLSEETSEAAL